MIDTGNTSEKIMIGVIGGNVCKPDEEKLAYEVGRLLAQGGAVLVCGGMGGVMQAACKGASEAGGLTVGILPGDSVQSANRYVRIPIATGMGIGRNIIIVRSAKCLIAINGRYGTLSEISYAMQLEKPVFALHPFLEVPGCQVVRTPAEAVDYALRC